MQQQVRITINLEIRNAINSLKRQGYELLSDAEIFKVALSKVVSTTSIPNKYDPDEYIGITGDPLSYEEFNKKIEEAENSKKFSYEEIKASLL